MQPAIRKPVVILVAIVITLACGSLIRPVTRHGHHHGAMADCVSNINQISKALVMYSADFDQRFPPSYQDADGSGSYEPNSAKEFDGQHDQAWAYLLFPYTRSFQMFTCKEFPLDQNWDGRIAPATDEHGISYGINSRLGEVDWLMTKVDYPSQTVAVFDIAPSLAQPWAGLFDEGNESYDDAIGNVELRVRDNHLRRERIRPGWNRTMDSFVIVGYCDGHCMSVRKSELLVTGDGPDGNLWKPRR